MRNPLFYGFGGAGVTPFVGNDGSVMVLRAVRRMWGAPLWAHVLTLLVVLLVMLPVLDVHWQWSADEGAVLAQAQQLADGGGWRFPVPFPEVDPQGEWFPIHLSERAADGQWVSYAKLPLYPVVVSVLLGSLGLPGVVLLGVAGTLVAAVCAALLVSGSSPGARRSTMWAVGLATPLFFYAYSVIAHSIGAAVVGLAAVGCQRWCRSGRTPWLLLVAGAVVVAIAVRNEAVLMVAAATFVFCVLAWRRSDRRLFAAALAVVVPALAMFLVNRVWYSRILDGGGDLRPPSLGEEAGFLASRWSGLVATTIRSGEHNLLLLAALVLALAAMLIRRRVASTLVVAGLGVTAMVLTLVSAVLQPLGNVPGLLLVTPILVAGLLLVVKDDVKGSPGVGLAVFSVFALGVLAAQYGVGGAGEWGGRFFAMGLPILVPVAVVALSRTRATTPETGRILVTTIVGMSLILAGLATATLRNAHELTEQVVTTVAEVAARTPAGDGGSPVVISTTPAVARLAWRDLPSGRWLLVEEDDLTLPIEQNEAFRRLNEAGVEAVTVTIVPGYELADPEGWSLVSKTMTTKGYGAAVYARDG